MNATRYLMLALTLAIGGLLSGCYSLEVKPEQRYDTSAAPAEDNRPSADILRENQQLRAQLGKLEKDYDNWQTAVRSRDAEKNALKRDRDDLKKDRDRWKKAAKRD